VRKRLDTTAESGGDRTTWSYDRAYQLTHERRSGLTSFDVTHAYDPAGNRLVQADSGARTTFSYDAANELTVALSAAGRTTYSYDACGNRTRQNAPASLVSYKWDEDGRLSEADTLTTPVTFTYNADGRRVQKRAGSTTQRYVYDFERVLQEADGTGATTEEFTSTLEPYGDLVSAYGGGQNLYYEYDALGSADALLDGNASVSSRYAYRAFGQLASQSGPGSSLSNPYTWVGRQGYFEDAETGLYLLRARYYDPAAARFLSEDPLGYRAGDANLYRYAGNDPVNGVDPSGLQVEPPPCGDPTGAACDIKGELEEITAAARRVAGEAKTFQEAWARNAPKYRSPLQSLLSAFDPREAGQAVAACACFLRANASREALSQGFDCPLAVGAAGFNFGLSLCGRGEPPMSPLTVKRKQGLRRGRQRRRAGDTAHARTP
jgi:RHS repeat-associated protein